MSMQSAFTQITFLCLAAIWAVVGLISGIALGINSSRLELKKYHSPLSFHPLVLFLLALLYWPVIVPWYIDIRSLRKKGELVLKTDQKNSSTHLWIRVACFLVVCLLPWIWYMSYYVCFPGPVAVFLNDPLSRLLLLIVLFIWQPIGLLYALHSKTFSEWLATCVLTAGPPIVLFMVGMPVFNLSLLVGAANVDELANLAKTFDKQLVFIMGIAWVIAVSVDLVLCVLSFPGLWIALSRKLTKKVADVENLAAPTT